MKSMTQFAFKYLVWFVPLWYGLSMFLTRKRGVEVTHHLAPWRIAEDLAYGRRWRRDPFRGKLDVLSHPTLTQHRIDKNLPIGDCDDHAMYWCVSLLKARLAKKVYFAFLQYKVGTSQRGHALCVYQGNDGNWYWADYDPPVMHDGGMDWARSVASAYGGAPVSAALIEVSLGKKDSGRFGKIIRQPRF